METNVLLLGVLGAGLILVIVFILYVVIPAIGRTEEMLGWLLDDAENKLAQVDTEIAADDSLVKDFLHAAVEQIAPHVDDPNDPAVKVLAKALQRPEFVKVAALLWQATPEDISPAAVAKVLAPIADKLIALTDDIPGNV